MSKGRGFESRRCILDGHNIFSHIFVVKIVMFENTKIKEKEVENGPFFKKKRGIILIETFSMFIAPLKQVRLLY